MFADNINLKVGGQRRGMVSGRWVGLLALTFCAGHISAQTISNALPANVTASSFSLVWQTVNAASSRIAIYTDAAGANNQAGLLGLEILPLRTGDPSVSPGVDRRQNWAGLRDKSRNLGLMQVRVSRCLPNTAYFYRIYATSTNGQEVGFPASGPLPSVTTARDSAFVNTAKQLLLTVPGGDVAGHIVTLSSTNAAYLLAAVIGDGAGTNQVYFNLSDFLSLDGASHLQPTNDQTFMVQWLRSELRAQGQPLVVAFTNDFVVAQANTATFQGPQARISGSVMYYDQLKPVAGVTLNLTGDASQTTSTATNGAHAFQVNTGRNYTITPVKTNDTPAALGISTVDILLMRQHILNITPLTSPYQLLAADVNASGTITTLDITFIRRLILAVTNSLPAGLWRFVRADYVFGDPLNPWNADGSRSYTNLLADLSGQDFLAIKLGDVNHSWTPPAGLQSLRNNPSSAMLPEHSANLMSQSQAHPAGAGGSGLPWVRFQAASVAVQPGETKPVTITIANFDHVTTVQFTLQWDPSILEYKSVGDFGLAGLGAGNFGTSQVPNGRLMFSWDDPSAVGVSVADGAAIFSINFMAKGRPGNTSPLTFTDQPTMREVTVNASLASFMSQDGGVALAAEAAPTTTLTVLPRTNGQFSLLVQGQIGTNYTLQVSTNLSAWQDLLRFNATNMPFVFIRTNAVSPQEFFRVRAP